MRKQSHKTNILSPGRSTLKFSYNYILSTIPNESQLLQACYCLLLLRTKKRKKRCNYLRQCEQICGSPFWGMGGKGSGALSFHHSSSDARLDLWLDSVSFLNIASKWSIFELFTRTSLLWIHQWVFMKLQPAPLLCTDSEVNLNSLSQRVHGKNDLMSPFLSIAVSFSWLWNDGFHIFNALLLRARKPLLSFTEQ